jgi:hypothetical protein
MQTFSRLDAGARPRAATDAPSLIPEEGDVARKRWSCRAAGRSPARDEASTGQRFGKVSRMRKSERRPRGLSSVTAGGRVVHGAWTRRCASRRADTGARAEVIVAGGAQPASPRRVGERRPLRLTFAGTCPHATQDHDDSDVRDRDSVGGLCGPLQLPAPSPLPPAGPRCYPAFFGSRGIRIQRAT